VGKRQLYTEGETIQKHRIHKIESNTYKTRKTNLKKILRNVSEVIDKQQIEANNNDTTYYTEPTYSYITINQ